MLYIIHRIESWCQVNLPSSCWSLTIQSNKCHFEKACLSSLHWIESRCQVNLMLVTYNSIQSQPVWSGHSRLDASIKDQSSHAAHYSTVLLVVYWPSHK